MLINENATGYRQNLSAEALPGDEETPSLDDMEEETEEPVLDEEDLEENDLTEEEAEEIDWDDKKQ